MQMVLIKGKEKGIVHTMDITLDHIRAVFIPKNFHEKYRYLGSVPWREDSALYKATLPLVLAMDYEAKPKYCPRWVLRFLHLFGSDNSIVRIRNWSLYSLERRLTKGVLFVDYKTKWKDYDLRISIRAPQYLQNLADDIERGFYSRGRQEELVAQIKSIDPNAPIIMGSIDRLVDQYNKLLDKKENG